MLKGDIKGKVKFKQNKQKEVTYDELSQEFYGLLEVKGLSQYTMKSYVFHNKYFKQYLDIKFEHRTVFCSSINIKLMEYYIRYLKDEKNISNGVTINSYIHNISPIIKYGISMGYIPKDFKIPTVKAQETFKEIYTQNELQRLLEKPKEESFVNIRTWAAIWLFSSTGIRATELRELKVGAVDLINRSITVNHTKNKKARYLPISKSLAEVLEDYLELRGGDNDDYLFCTVYGDILCSSTLQDSIKTYCNERNVNKTSLHLFRHTFITNAVNANVSPLILKKITGHSTLKELNRYYNASVQDTVSIIDNIAPKLDVKTSMFKKSK